MLYYGRGTVRCAGCMLFSSDSLRRLLFTCRRISATTARIRVRIPKSRDHYPVAGAPARDISSHFRLCRRRIIVSVFEDGVVSSFFNEPKPVMMMGCLSFNLVVYGSFMAAGLATRLRSIPGQECGPSSLSGLVRIIGIRLVTVGAIRFKERFTICGGGWGYGRKQEEERDNLQKFC